MFWCWYFMVVLTVVCPMIFMTAVFGRTIRLSSKAMTRAVEDEVLWQPSLLPGFLELLSDSCQMPTPGALGGKDPSLFLLRVSRQKCMTNTRTDWHLDKLENIAFCHSCVHISGI